MAAMAIVAGAALVGCDDTADPPTTPPTAPDLQLPNEPSEGPGGVVPPPQSPRDNDPTPAPPPPGPRPGGDDDSGFGVLED